VSDPNFLQEFVALVKKYCHVVILEWDDLWTLASNVKGQEAEFLVSCNLIGENQWPLELRPQCGAALTLAIVFSVNGISYHCDNFLDDNFHE
jgi:hypothetical protein